MSCDDEIFLINHAMLCGRYSTLQCRYTNVQNEPVSCASNKKENFLPLVILVKWHFKLLPSSCIVAVSLVCSYTIVNSADFMGPEALEPPNIWALGSCNISAPSIIHRWNRRRCENYQLIQFFFKSKWHCRPMFDQLRLRKIIKFVAARCQMLRLQCTKIDFGWGFAPDPTEGVYSAPQTP